MINRIVTVLLLIPLDGTNITLRKRVGGFYDANIDFDATSYNRGWITIIYIA